MGAGKTLSIIAGFISLIATWLFTLFRFELAENTYYVSGILGIIRVIYIFVDSISLIYILGGIFLLIFLFSGVLQLIGVKRRVFAFIGSFLPIFFGIIILLNSPLMGTLYVLGDSEPIIQGILPFDVYIAGSSVSLGTYLLIAGGILGFISGCFERGEV